MKRIYGMGVLASLFALAAMAQDVEMKKQLDQEVSKQLDETLSTLKMTMIRSEGGVMSSVKNAPYRADQITETTQTLGDGTRIHNERRMTIYRDSQGRVRREFPDEVSIMDPNSGVGYTLNTKDLTYRKMTVHVSVSSATPGGSVTASSSGAGGGSAFFFPSPAGAVAVAGGGRGDNVKFIATQAAADGPNIGVAYTFNGQTVTMSTSTTASQKKESLGTQNMEGVNALGDRRTSTIETGAIGNDRPLQIVSERWYSPDLQVEVMTKHSDPRTGEEVMRLTNINRAEPDPSLFQPPAGYQLIEGSAGRGGRGVRQ